MYNDRRGDDGTTTARWDICRVAHDFGALASLGEGDDGGHLRCEQLLFLVCLYLNENYTAEPQNKLPPRHKKLNWHWISLWRVYDAASERAALSVKNTRSNCLSASCETNAESYRKYQPRHNGHQQTKQTHVDRERRHHNRRCGVVRPPWKALPQLFGDERHERMEQPQSMVQTCIQRLLRRRARLDWGSVVCHWFHRFLESRTKV